MGGVCIVNIEIVIFRRACGDSLPESGGVSGGGCGDEGC